MRLSMTDVRSREYNLRHKKYTRADINVSLLESHSNRSSDIAVLERYIKVWNEYDSRDEIRSFTRVLESLNKFYNREEVIKFNKNKAVFIFSEQVLPYMKNIRQARSIISTNVNNSILKDILIKECNNVLACDRVINNQIKLESVIDITNIDDNNPIDTIYELCSSIDNIDMPFTTKYNLCLENISYTLNKLKINTTKEEILTTISEYFLYRIDTNETIDMKDIIEETLFFDDIDKEHTLGILSNTLTYSYTENDQNLDTLPNSMGINNIDNNISKLETYSYIENDQKSNNIVENAIGSYIKGGLVDRVLYSDDNDSINQLVTEAMKSNPVRNILNKYKPHGLKSLGETRTLVSLMYGKSINNVIDETPNYLNWVRQGLVYGTLGINIYLGAITIFVDYFIKNTVLRRDTTRMITKLKHEIDICNKKKDKLKNENKIKDMEKYISNLESNLSKVENYEEKLYTERGLDARKESGILLNNIDNKKEGDECNMNNIVNESVIGSKGYYISGKDKYKIGDVVDRSYIPKTKEAALSAAVSVDAIPGCRVRYIKSKFTVTIKDNKVLDSKVCVYTLKKDIIGKDYRVKSIDEVSLKTLLKITKVEYNIATGGADRKQVYDKVISSFKSNISKYKLLNSCTSFSKNNSELKDFLSGEEDMLVIGDYEFRTLKDRNEMLDANGELDKFVSDMNKDLKGTGYYIDAEGHKDGLITLEVGDSDILESVNMSIEDENNKTDIEAYINGDVITAEEYLKEHHPIVNATAVEMIKSFKSITSAKYKKLVEDKVLCTNDSFLKFQYANEKSIENFISSDNKIFLPIGDCLPLNSNIKDIDVRCILDDIISILEDRLLKQINFSLIYEGDSDLYSIYLIYEVKIECDCKDTVDDSLLEAVRIIGNADVITNEAVKTMELLEEDVKESISSYDNETIDLYTEFAIKNPDCIDIELLKETLIQEQNDSRNRISGLDVYKRLSCLESNIYKLKNSKVDEYKGRYYTINRLAETVEILEAVNNLNNDILNESTVKNTLMMAKEKLKKNALKLSDAEKGWSRQIDGSMDRMQTAIQKELAHKNREAVIKGKVLPSASSVIKIAITTGAAYLVNPALAVITVLGGLAAAKVGTKREKQFILDEIDIQLKLVEKKISLAESNNDMKSLEQLLKIEQQLKREKQRIMYKLRNYYPVVAGGGRD